MDSIVRKLSLRPTVVLGGAVLLGVLEFVALQRSHWLNRLGREQDEELTQAA